MIDGEMALPAGLLIELEATGTEIYQGICPVLQGVLDVLEAGFLCPVPEPPEGQDIATTEGVLPVVAPGHSLAADELQQLIQEGLLSLGIAGGAGPLVGYFHI